MLEDLEVCCREWLRRCHASLMRLQGATHGDTDVRARYAEARPGASTIIAAGCAGGTMMTSGSHGRLMPCISRLLIINSTEKVCLFEGTVNSRNLVLCAGLSLFPYIGRS